MTLETALKIFAAALMSIYLIGTPITIIHFLIKERKDKKTKL